MDEKLKELLKKAERWIDAHRAEFISELQAFTRIPSVSRADLAEDGAPFGPDCRKMLDFALERGRYYGFETMNHDGYAGSICYGDPDNAIGIFAHLDVVPVEDGWLYPPFEATYLPEHDAIIGRGADDNKCAAVAGLFVMRMLREFGWPLKHGIRLICGTSEETGMQDMTALKEKGFSFPKLSLVPDSGFPVNCGQKGMIDAELTIPCEGNLLCFDAGTARNAVPNHAECVVAIDKTAADTALAKLPPAYTQPLTVSACADGTRICAKGVSAHASAPQNGQNAIHLLSRALVESGLLIGSCENAMRRVCELSGDFTGKNEGVAYRDELSGDLTLVYGVAHLSDGCLTLTADSRTPVTCDADELIANMQQSWQSRGFTVSSSHVSKPYYIPKDDPYVVALQDLFHAITGRDNEPFVMGGGNYARVVPNAISFGPGMETEKKISDFLPEGRGGCHGLDEAIVMEKVHNCAKIYVPAVAMLDQMLD